MTNPVFLCTILISFAMTLFQCNSSDIKKDSEGKKTENKTGSNFNRYFPISEGNYWTYINEAPRDESEIYTVRAEDLKKIESGIQAKMSCFPYLTKETTPQTIKIKSSGEIEISNYLGSTGVIIPSADNFKKGYLWNFGIFGGSINSDNERIKTESGTFDDCYFVLMTDGFTFSFEMWFKKDVGIVKWGSNRTNPPTFKPIYYVLKEYKIN